MARVLLTAEAKEDVRDLDGAAKKVVLKAMKKLESEPEKRGDPLGSQVDDLTTFRKLVVGNRDYRIVYRIERGTVVVVWVVAKRAESECYELAVSRLRLYEDKTLATELERMIDSIWSRTDSV